MHRFSAGIQVPESICLAFSSCPALGGPEPATPCPSVNLGSGMNSLSPSRDEVLALHSEPQHTVLCVPQARGAWTTICQVSEHTEGMHFPPTLHREDEHSLCTPWGCSSRRSRVGGSCEQRCQSGLGARGSPSSWSARHRHLCALCRPAREGSQAAAVIRLTQTFPIWLLF